MSENFQKILLNEVSQLLEPLVVASESKEARTKLFDNLGWNLEAITGFPTTDLENLLNTLVTAYKKIQAWVETPPTTLADFIEALKTVEETMGVIQQLHKIMDAHGLVKPMGFEYLADDLIEFLAVEYLLTYHPSVYNIVSLVTLITARTTPDVTVVDTATNIIIRHARQRPELHLEHISELITDPVKRLKTYYLGTNELATYDDAKATAAKLFPRLEELLTIFGVQTISGLNPNYGISLGLGGDEIAQSSMGMFIPLEPDPALAGSGLGLIVSLSSADRGDLGLVISPFGRLSFSQDFNSWKAEMRLEGGAGGFAIHPKNGVRLPNAAQDASISFHALLSKLSDETGTAFQIGSTQGTRLEVGRFALIGDAKFGVSSLEYGFLIEIGSATIVVSPGEGDGFLQKVLPQDGFRTDFDLAIGWSNQKGLYFRGSASLEATLAVHKTLLGVITVDSVYLAIQTSSASSDIKIVLAATASLKLGPILASVQQIGLKALLTFPQNGGNLGPAKVVPGFKAPSGAGLSIDANAVVGGGYLFFDDEKQQYGGVLYLEVKGGIAIKAIGLITTKMPDGSSGFSFLMIITVEFTPVPLGFNFFLNGVGGLAGFNRTMNLNALRDGVKNRTLDSIMFPPDPVANAPKIISDLQTVFPPASGRFIFAPMVKISWGQSVLIMEIGLAVELPLPLRLVIMGKLHLKLPPLKEDADEEESKALVEMHMDVLGIIDFDKSEASVDAVLYNSRIVEFPVSGGMAMRLRWGNDPVFALAIGGFNPRFTPPPGFPLVDRLALQLSYESGGLTARLRLESYLAVTTNTLQFGARIDAYAKLSEVKATGYLGFDALIEFFPFHFIVDIYAGISVEAYGFHFSVDLLLTLSGPGLWLGDGHFTVEFCGKHEFPIHFTVGQEQETPALPPVNPLDELTAALSDPRNWSAALPAGESMIVTLRQLSIEETQNMVLAHPLGELTVRQKVLPLGITLERFGASVPTSPGPFDIEKFLLGTTKEVKRDPKRPDLDVCDAFARGQFVNLTEDQKFSAPAFECLRSGQRRIGTEAVVYKTEGKPNPAQKRTFAYDVTIIDDKDNNKKRSSKKDELLRQSITNNAMLRAAEFGAASPSPMVSTGSAKFKASPQGIRVRQPVYVVAGKNDLKAKGTITYNTYTEAEVARRDSGDAFQVVEAHEVV